MKFPEIWILNRLKRSGGQLVALKVVGVWLGGYFGIGFDTVIHLCYSTQCSCTKIVHLDIETQAVEPH